MGIAFANLNVNESFYKDGPLSNFFLINNLNRYKTMKIDTCCVHFLWLEGEIAYGVFHISFQNGYCCLLGGKSIADNI